MEDSTLNRAMQSVYESTETGIKSSVVGGFVINLLVAGSLSLILSMINSLQLIVHLPLINVSTPANVMSVVEVLVPIVMFDVLESENLEGLL